jgi:hypothetical protein
MWLGVFLCWFLRASVLLGDLGGEDRLPSSGVPRALAIPA